MAAKYYPLESDYQSVLDWITGAGLTVTLQDPSRLVVFASGPVSQVSQFLGVSMARVSAASVEYTSAVSAPSVPAALAPLVLGINGLQPYVMAQRHSIIRQLQANSTTGNGPPFLPSQIAQAYQANTLTENGSGQKIAIVIDTFPLTTDLTSFWAACNVSQTLSNIEFVQVVSGSLPAPSGEETIDVEWSSSIAPSAMVRVYATKSLSFVNLDKAYMRIFSDLPSQPLLHVVSLSYGLGETYVSASQVRTDAQLLANLASAGVTVFVASGDGASSPGTAGKPNTGPTQVETPASDASVTGVGGTSLTVDSVTGNVTSEVAWPDTGGGLSIYTNRPTWQMGTGVPGGTTRLVPDVASVADPNTGGFLILNGEEYIFGGTSWGAPVWAGFGALIIQSRENAGLSSLGLLGPAIYPLLGSPGFRDITSGSNGAYSAGPGYDLCTGIGVPDVSLLLSALTPVAPAITGQPQNASIDAGESALFSVTANANSPLSYQWQVSADGGSTWTNISDSAPYNGSQTSSLQVSSPGAGLNGAQFRCVVTDSSGSTTSSPAVLSVLSTESEPAMPPWALAALALILISCGTAALARSSRRTFLHP
jgi:kumamolisin